MKADVERRFCLKEQERLYDGIEYLDMIKGGAFLQICVQFIYGIEGS